MEKLHLSNLKTLEAESIHIIREVVAEFERPVMLYSVGKDSSVMVRLAQKAFAPGRIPFPLLHVDTGMKFPEMYEFRDAFCSEIGADLLVYRFEEAIAQGDRPVEAGDGQVLRAAQDPGPAERAAPRAATTPRSAGRAAMKKNRAQRSGSIPSATRSASGTPRTSAPSCGTSTTAASRRARAFECFPISNWTELDVWLYIHAEKIPVVPMYFASPSARW